MTERDACIVLNLLSGIGSSKFASLRQYFGSAAAALDASFDDLRRVPGIGGVLAEEISGWRVKARFDDEMSLCERGGARVITLVDKEYPPQLAEVPDPPLCLYVRGVLDVPYTTTLAVVGSRRITNYGRQMAEFLAGAAAYAGWTVASGLALGIDAVAHKAAIDAKGKTVAVLGGGLARVFPQEHVPLANEIIDAGGGVVSEFPMEFPPNRQTFPMRNRVVSGMSRGVLVVEAGAKSGALITANFALDQGRSVFAVPGRADSPQSKGCHALIKQGAKLAETFDDIVEDFEYLPGMSEAERRRPPATERKPQAATSAPAPKADMTDEEGKIVELLSMEGELGIDAIAGRLGAPVGKLLSALSRLEMRKAIIQSTGKRFSLPVRR